MDNSDTLFGLLGPLLLHGKGLQCPCWKVWSLNLTCVLDNNSMTCFIDSWLPARLSAQMIQSEKGVAYLSGYLTFQGHLYVPSGGRTVGWLRLGGSWGVSAPALCSSSDTSSSLLWTIWVVVISRHGHSVPSLGNLPGVFLCLDGAQSILFCAHSLLSHHWTPLSVIWLLLYSLPSRIYYTLVRRKLSLLQARQS